MVSPTSPAPSPPGDSFHNLQRTSWEQQRSRSFDSTRGRAQVVLPAERARSQRRSIGPLSTSPAHMAMTKTNERHIHVQ